MAKLSVGEASTGIGFDRLIRSDRPIRGVLTRPAEIPANVPWDAPADGIVVRWHPAAVESEAPYWSGDAHALCFAVPGIARYRCTRGSISVTPQPDADPAMVDALLIATAFPALLWIGGAFVLHASAVAVRAGKNTESRALAIAGETGSGKSRLAAALIAQGGALVADDSVAIQWRGDCAIGSGLAQGFHLGAPGVEDRPFHPVSRAARSAPLAAVVILGDHHRAGPLDLPEAAGLLLAYRHRASIPRYLGIESRVLADAVRLARTVPVYRWRREDADQLLNERVQADIIGTGEAR